MSDFRRGEIWQVDFDPQLGSEIAKQRPALIISANSFNSISEHVGVLVVVPGTTKRLENPRTGQLATGYCEVQPSEKNGLKQTTYFIAHQVRSVSLFRMKKRMGMLEFSRRQKISSDVANVLGLYEDLGT